MRRSSPFLILATRLSIYQIVPLIRSGQHKAYIAILVLLFIAIVAHLSANWSALRDIVISHNDTRNIMAQASLGGLNPIIIPANVAAFMAIWLGDVLLVCIYI